MDTIITKEAVCAAFKDFVGGYSKIEPQAINLYDKLYEDVGLELFHLGGILSQIQVFYGISFSLKESVELETVSDLVVLAFNKIKEKEGAI